MAAQRPAWSLAIVAGIGGGALLAAFEAALALRDGGPDRARLALLIALLLPATGAVLGAAAGLVASAVGALAGLLGRRWRDPDSWASWLGAALAVAPAAWLAAQAFHGRFARTIPYHRALAALLGLALVAAAFGLVRLALAVRRRWRAGRLAPQAGWLLAVLLVGLAALAYVADRRVLPRLYPSLHWALFGAAFLAAALGALAAGLARPRPARLAPRAAALAFVALLVTALGGGAGALALVGRSQALRALALARTAATRKALTLARATRLLRPPALLAATGPAPPSWRGTLPPGPTFPGRDVVLISIDAVRADHLGAYGYGRPTSPAIDALARDGVVFEHAYAPVPLTTYSLATLLTGRYLYPLTRLGERPPDETLARLFRRHGYQTAGFFPPAVFFDDAQKLTAYEQRRFDFEYVKYEYLDARPRTDQVIAYFEQVRPGRAFVWVHYFEPHEPYERHAGHDFGARDVDRYDGEIAYVDAQVGRLVGWLRRHRPRAVVVVTADHGEEFGDHGGHYHGSSVYEEQVRVPLVLATPGLRPRRIGVPVGTIDLAATLLRLVGLPAPAELRGPDLGPWLAGQPPDAAAPPAFSEIGQLKLVARGTSRLICDLTQGACELYDLARDPRERRNLVDASFTTAAALRADLEEWLTSHGTRGAGAPAGTALAQRALQRGRLGDASAVPELAAVLRGAPSPARREAARILWSLRTPAARQALARFLDDPDPAVAVAAASAAAPLSPAARARARALLTRAGTAPQARLWAAVGLAEAGDRAGVPVLAAAVAGACTTVVDGSAADGRCLERLDLDLARYLVQLLGQLGDRRAVPGLLAARAGVPLRPAVITALGALGGPRVEAVLARELVTEPQVEPRAAIARALGQIGDRRAVGALRRAFARETEPVPAREEFLALCRLGAARGTGRAVVDLSRWRAGPSRRVVLHLGPPHGSRFDLWLLAAPGARGPVAVRSAAGPLGGLVLDGTTRVYRLEVPAAAVPRSGRVELTLAREAGAPRLEAAWLRSLTPVAPSAPAPAIERVPRAQQLPAPGAAPAARE